MTTRKAVGHELFNDNIERGADKTLRRSDVKRGQQLGEWMGREMIDSQLGDPTRHGLTTYHVLNSIHTDVSMEGEIRSAITDIAQGMEEAEARKSLEAILEGEGRIQGLRSFMNEHLGSRGERLSDLAQIIGEERVTSAIQGFLDDPLGPSATSYHDSSGYIKLREILAKRPELGPGQEITADCVFIGCGVSGVVRAFYKTVLKPIETASHEKIDDLLTTVTGALKEIARKIGEIAGRLGIESLVDIRGWQQWKKAERKLADIREIVDDRPEIIVPEGCYPLYFAESAFAGAKITDVRLRKEDGQLDLEELEKKITENTRVINLITVGNPIGTGMKKDVFVEALKIINRAGKDYGKPIFVVCDTIYEPFRMDREERIEPVKLHAQLHAEEGMDHVVVVDVSSISKMAAVPGGRVGWAKVSWLGKTYEEERGQFLGEYMVNVQNPLLTPSAACWQMATEEFFVRLETDPELRKEYEEFKGGRRAECNRRVWGFIEGLEDVNKRIIEEFGVAVPPVVFHPGYYVKGKMDRTRFNNFYLVFGFNEVYSPRDSGYSAARRIADFAGWNGEPGGGYAVPLFTPGSNFPFLVDNGTNQDYMRAVALFSDERREKVLLTIEAYARLIAGAWCRRNPGQRQDASDGNPG
jgi:aspartate/methionine/tyrosine aminotransferase